MFELTHQISNTEYNHLTWLEIWGVYVVTVLCSCVYMKISINVLKVINLQYLKKIAVNTWNWYSLKVRRKYLILQIAKQIMQDLLGLCDMDS